MLHAALPATGVRSTSSGAFSLLGAPIGPPACCEAYTMTERVEKARPLFAELASLLDAQTTLLLLHHCAAFCALPSLPESRRLGSTSAPFHAFDAEVRACLAHLCTGPRSLRRLGTRPLSPRCSSPLAMRQLPTSPPSPPLASRAPQAQDRAVFAELLVPLACGSACLLPLPILPPPCVTGWPTVMATTPAAALAGGDRVKSHNRLRAVVQLAAWGLNSKGPACSPSDPLPISRCSAPFPTCLSMSN